MPYEVIGPTVSGAGSLSNPVTPAEGGTGTTTVFTQGSVVYAGAAGVYSQDNAHFFYDATNFRVLVGTNAPIASQSTQASINVLSPVAAVCEMGSSRADADVTLLGQFSASDALNVTDANKNIGTINISRSGTTANRRGGAIIFGTRPDNSTVPVERMRVDNAGSVRVGTAAIATTATDGFLHIPTCAGTPTGVPTITTGLVPMVYDSTNNIFYIYAGGAWKQPKVAGVAAPFA